MSDFQPDPALYPFKSHWAHLADGSRVHYVDEGSGPVLLLLHGNPAWSFLYRNIILGLRGNFRCIAPDLPGFGLSQARPGFNYTAQEHAEVMVAFADHLALQDAGVTMQDWGGPIGLHLAQSRPQAISRLIIGNTFAWPFSRLRPRIFSALMGGLPGRLSATAFNGVLRWFFTFGVAAPLADNVWRMYQAPFGNRANRRPTHIFPKQLTAAHGFLSEIEAQLPAISETPALLLWGEKDFAFKTYERNRFKTAFPNHRDVTLPNAGHFIQEDAPEAICEAIAKWFAPLI